MWIHTKEPQVFRDPAIDWTPVTGQKGLSTTILVHCRPRGLPQLIQNIGGRMQVPSLPVSEVLYESTPPPWAVPLPFPVKLSLPFPIIPLLDLVTSGSHGIRALPQPSPAKLQEAEELICTMNR